MEEYDVIIIGGGVSALSAALYSARFELKTLVLAENIGGAVMNTSDIANYPGFDKIAGFELIDKIQNQVPKDKATIVTEKAEKIRKNKLFKVKTSSAEYSGKTLIYAAGTEWRKLNVPGEKEFSGKGVHYCAICDGAFYKNKVIAVVGGSDSAVKEALLLTQYGSKVYLIARSDLRAEPITITQLNENKKIEVLKKTNVTSIKGDKFVTGIKLDCSYNGNDLLKVDAVFIAIGHVPLSEAAKDLGVKVNKKDEIIIDKHGYTNIDGFYASGDVVDSNFKQIITAVAQGVTAAYNSYQYIKNRKID